MKPTNILIIADDPAHYESMLDGFEVRTASSAGSAFAILQMFKADVVLLDLQHGNELAMTWLDAARQLPGLERLPVIVITARPSAEYREYAALERAA